MSGEKYSTATLIFKPDDVEVQLTGIQHVSPQRLFVAGNKLNKKFRELRGVAIRETNERAAAKERGEETAKTEVVPATLTAPPVVTNTPPKPPSSSGLKTGIETVTTTKNDSPTITPPAKNTK